MCSAALICAMGQKGKRHTQPQSSLMCNDMKMVYLII